MPARMMANWREYAVITWFKRTRILVSTLAIGGLAATGTDTGAWFSHGDE
jgi:hypothetical protein